MRNARHRSAIRACVQSLSQFAGSICRDKRLTVRNRRGQPNRTRHKNEGVVRVSIAPPSLTTTVTLVASVPTRHERAINTLNTREFRDCDPRRPRSFTVQLDSRPLELLRRLAQLLSRRPRAVGCRAMVASHADTMYLVRAGGAPRSRGGVTVYAVSAEPLLDAGGRPRT
jgi:hypothetical protein